MAERFLNAAKDGYLDILRQGTRKELNSQDDDGMSPTLWAAHSGHLEALRLIVGREGDVNKSDYLGLTALHHAAMRGHIGVVSYLVNWGCNVYALDNDMQSAMDLAALHDRKDIVKFLDNDMAQRQQKNPRHAARQREEAVRAAETNLKKYEKMLEAASKKREKEEKKRQKELGNMQQYNGKSETKSKNSFFKNLTLRGTKGRTQGSRLESNYSDFAGMTVSSGTRKGVAKKLQMKQNDAMISNTSMRSDFKVSDFDPNGQRTVRSVGPGQGYLGSTAGVMYMTSSKVRDDLQQQKRTVLSADFFQKSNLYKAKSESDLLDSGVDSFNGDDEDEDNAPGMFNRPEFGKLAFFQKNNFLSTIHSLDDHSSSKPSRPDEHPENRRLSGDGQEGQEDTDESRRKDHKNHSLPWDQDDLETLDDEDEEQSELSAVNMFLWSCGLANFLHIFSQEKIDMSLLMSVTDAELKELGLPFGPRKKLREAIMRRKTVLETPIVMTDSYL